MNMEMPSRFEAGVIENKWYRFWEESGVFAPGKSEGKMPFAIMMPPPNVTGALHMGHALNNTLQDIVARFKRMQGFCVLWQPGTDHAGIATQAVVEKKLWLEQGQSREAMGREAFVAEVWKWKEQYGSTILNQLRRLGCSADWSRTRFTLDEGLSLAVRESFVRLWERGLIYRGARLINWDCKLQTAVSDDEIEQSEIKGNLWFIRYPVKGQPGRHVVVATTRPETMFGDTAVAVHPEDERYADLIGKSLILPIAGRELPVIADPSVEREFGTGAVKVTPGHDPNDYERGQRFALPIVNVLNKDGTLNENAGKYQGVERLKARPQLVEELNALNLLEKVEEHVHNVPHSDRSKTPIEPLVSEQWFVAMQQLAAPAIAAVKPNELGLREIRFVPERWESVYLQWLENVKDWCISRQLWWGHRIPVWYDEDGESVALRDDPAPGAVHPKTGKPLVRQDDDVLDTWASSWLWPFSTLGWPEDTQDLRYFYPTGFLSTDRGIIYLWVARMVMASYAFLDKKPFDVVNIHATVLDEHGRRMSKSLGNGIDPIEMIDAWGVDAVRLTLPLLTNEGQDIKLAATRFEMGRNFCNKLWNACRFALSNLDGFVEAFEALPPELRNSRYLGQVVALEDRYIENKLATVAARVTASLEQYKFNEFGQTLYRYVWDEFCDWYLEIIKPRLYDGKGGDLGKLTAQVVLIRQIDAILRMLHPYIPFITEEIWQNLRPALTVLSDEELPVALAAASWPKPIAPIEPDGVEERFEFLREVVRGIRNIRSEHNLDRRTELQAVVRTGDAATVALIGSEEAAIIRHLVKLSHLDVSPDLARPKAAATFVLGGGSEVYVSLTGLIDFGMEIKRLQAARAKTVEVLEKTEAKLRNESYVQRAPAEVVQKDRDRCIELASELVRTDKHIAELALLAEEG